MDSINRNQPEDNYEELRGSDAVRKIREMVEQAQTCFFCTEVPPGESGGARPMNVRQVDDEGNLWFLSANDSHVNREIFLHPAVRLYMQGSKHADFLSIDGHATISADREKIRELWNPLINTWFTEGVDDPRITVIKVAPYDGYYWDTKHGHAVASAKMLLGAVLHKTLDDSVEGKLRP